MQAESTCVGDGTSFISINDPAHMRNYIAYVHVCYEIAYYAIEWVLIV